MPTREFAFRPGRVDVEMPVRVTTSDGTFAVTSRNIGRGGLFAATEKPSRVGDRLRLEFALPLPGQPIVVEAEVCWVRQNPGFPSGMGVRFVDLSLDAAIAIQEFMRRVDEDLTPSWPST